MLYITVFLNMLLDNFRLQFSLETLLSAFIVVGHIEVKFRFHLQESMFHCPP